MTDIAKMVPGARNALVRVLEMNESDTVLILNEPALEAVGRAFAAAAAEIGCPTDVFMLPVEGRPLRDLPDGLIEMLDGKTVVINAIVGDSDEIPFRIKWIQEIERRKLRMGHAPGVEEGMLAEGGPMDVDYAAMQDSADRLIDALDGADRVEITTAAGTDVVLGISGRKTVSDVRITGVDRGVNLPCGEVYCCPVETRADGVLVVDGCVGGDGNPPGPITMRIAEGRVTSVVCADDAWRRRVESLLDTDEGARTIAELGIGLNPGARLIGCMLEDEKALRTAHIAFGSNQGMPGGQSVSNTHVDYLFHAPTITAVLADGARRTILKNGDIVV